MLEFFMDKKSYVKFGSWDGPIPQVGDIVLLGDDSFFRVIQRVIDQTGGNVNGNVYLFIKKLPIVSCWISLGTDFMNLLCRRNKR